MSGSLGNVTLLLRERPIPWYSPEFRESVAKKMMSPSAQSNASISRETFICPPTLYSWRNQSHKEWSVVPAATSRTDPFYWCSLIPSSFRVFLSSLPFKKLGKTIRADLLEITVAYIILRTAGQLPTYHSQNLMHASDHFSHYSKESRRSIRELQFMR